MADILTGSQEPQQQQSKPSPQVENRKKTHQEDFFWQDKHLEYKEEAHDTYLNLPIGDKFGNEQYNKNYTSKYRREENKTCTRCGEKGHIRKYCKVKRTYCEYCKTKTHKTEACIIHLYLKRCPTASSRQSTPEPNRAEQQKGTPAKHQQKRDEIPPQPPLKEKRRKSKSSKSKSSKSKK